MNPLTPRYIQIRQAIERQIRKGTLKPGDKLPSENELQKMYQASRTPVRMALEALETSGLIYRSQGRGSFVRNASPGGAVREMVTFGQILRDQGHSIKAKTLSIETCFCDAALAKRLEVNIQDEAIALRRLLIVDDEPFVVFNHWIKPVISVETLKREGDFPSLDELLKREGYEPWESMQLIGATLITEEDAAILGVTLPAAALEIKQTNYTIRKEVIWYSHFIVRADRYEYPVMLQRR